MSELEQRLGAWLTALSGRTGVALALDAQGACGIACGEGLEVGVVALEPDRLGLFAAVARITDENRVRLSRQLLSRNLFGNSPAGAALGADDDTGTAYLCLAMNAALLDAEGFQDRLGEFILAARATLVEFAASDSQPAPAAEQAPHPWAFQRA